MADRRDHAVATANAYHQGNIAGLDDAMTRRLIASTVMTESNGGDLAITNRQGYVGRYQAGADWLADAGYIDKHKLAEAMQGQRNEWAWAVSGGMTRFLEDPSNWKNSLSLEKYKASPDLQDRAFKINSDHAYHQAVGNGVLKEGDNPAKVAGFLKARHIAGYGGAVAALTGGRVIRDSNGTSNYDYMHDITRNRDGLDQRMGHTLHRQDGQTDPARSHVTDGMLKEGTHGQAVHDLQTNLAKLGYTDHRGKPLPVDGVFGIDTRHVVERFQHDHHLTVDGKVGPLTQQAMHSALQQTTARDLTNSRNPDHTLYEQALAGIRVLDAQHGRPTNQQSLNLAAALAVEAKQQGMTRIDQIALGDNGNRAYIAQNPRSPMETATYGSVDTATAVHTPIAQSSAAAAAMPAAPNQTQPAVTPSLPSQVHSLPI
jgi:peptidoglycan hydrolase-like protein with peptidoglycan-binding domain